MSDVKYDMAGRPLPDRTYPAETGSAGYQLWERTLGQWLEYWAETTPDKDTQTATCASPGRSSTSVWIIWLKA